MLCVEFPQVYYIDLIEIFHALKAFAVATSEDLNLSAIFVVSDSVSFWVLRTSPLTEGQDEGPWISAIYQLNFRPFLS